MSTDARRALAAVEARIAEAARRSGRDPSAVELVAVSKTHTPDRVRELLDHGHTLFGENRIQEALAKIPAVGPGARWHFIGHLQRNKARKTVGLFELIQSLDTPELARELDRRNRAAGTRQPVLIQVHLGGETTKSGVSPRDLAPLVERVAGLAHLDLQGLMTIPPPAPDPEASRPYFARMRALLEEAASGLGRPLPHLSMGMSADFAVAVEEGATLVRVGTAIFGERQ